MKVQNPNKRLQELKESPKVNRTFQAREIISGFSNAIANISVNSNFTMAVDTILSCNGKIITTGMGKAGIAMRKFSSTLCSLGFSACYLHPGEAMHGDLGIVNQNDILFVASTSGKTREILDLLDIIKSNISVSRIIAITSHLNSPLREKVDVVLDMGIIKESGNIGLAPTTSILVMLAICDTLAIVASEEKGFGVKDFKKYHHSGYLGQMARGDNVIY